MDIHSSLLSNKSNRNLDHLYCHPNESNQNVAANQYMRGNSGTASATEMVSVLKEIKQLKAMLLLHLDLIQEQSDQLMSKDKMMASLRKENEILRARVERYDKSNSNATPPPPPPPTAPILVPNKHYQPVATANNTNINNNNRSKDALPTVRGSISVNVVPPTTTCTGNTVDENNCEMPEIKAKCDILKKFSAKLLSSCSMKLTSLSETIESRYKICDFEDQDRQVLSLRVSQPSTTTTSSLANVMTSANPTTVSLTLQPIAAETQTTASPIASSDGRNSIIGEYEGKYINKIILQRIPGANDKDSNLMKIKTEFQNEEDDENITEIIEYVAAINSGPKLQMTLSPTESIQKTEALPSIISGASELIDIRKFLVDDQLNRVVECKSPVLTTNTEAKAESRRRHIGEDIEAAIARKRRRCDRSLAVTPSQHEAKSSDRFQTSNDPTDQSGNCPPAMLLEDDETFAESMSPSTKHTYPPRRAFMQTQQLYMTREWKMDEIEAEVNKQITDMGGDERVTSFNEVVNLEVPRWTVKECTGLYSIEGTEDLSEDTFMKRHARLEHDEKKRKKWDVQRIREQRTIERLKRRHCKKEELENSQKDAEDLGTFYPLAENIKFIQVTDELPVQAFGEAIPLLSVSDFTLPWMQHHRAVTSILPTTLSSLSHHQAERPILQRHTTITFANKKKCVRRHTNSASSSTTTPTRPRGSRRTKR